ncbi:hypothetical protein ACJ41O_001373 [Fusarium nematophilum]
MENPSTPAHLGPAVVHPSSIVHKSSTLGLGVQVGPFCSVGPHVQIGDGTKQLSHVSIVGHSTIGQHCTILLHATIGTVAQHGLWKGGDEARVLIGDDCIIRENATIHRSTHGLDRPTTIGNRAFIMTGVHVAHDAVLEDDAGIATLLTDGTVRDEVQRMVDFCSKSERSLPTTRLSGYR